MLNYFLLAFCVSVDSFGIGITYGVKNTKISISAKIVLFILALIIANISIWFGQLLTHFLPEYISLLLRKLNTNFYGNMDYLSIYI